MPADRRFILGLFAVALGVRVLYGILAGTYLAGGPALATAELRYAEVIASGLQWVSTPRSSLSPGYPALLALFYLLAAKQIWITFFLQAALSALSVVVLYFTATGLVGRRLAVIAALWLALDFVHLHYTSLFQRDCLTVLLLLLLISILARPLVRMRFGAFAGAIYAALIHVDPQFILIAPVLAFLVFFKARYRILNLQYLFVFAGVTLALSLPWTVRNYVVYHQPIPVGLEAERYLKPLRIFATDTDATITSVQEKVASASTTRRLQRNTVAFWRVARLSGGSPSSKGGRIKPAWSPRHNIIGIATYGLLYPFLVFGAAVALRRRERTAWMLALVIAAYFLMRAWLGGSERARLAIDPLIILLAFYGLRVFVEGVVSRRHEAEAES